MRKKTVFTMTTSTTIFQGCRILIFTLCCLIVGFHPVHACGRKREKNCLCLEEFASGLRDPILAIHANDNTHRLFVAEQIGMVHVYQQDKTRLEEPFLDIQTQVIVNPDSYDERGFLGLAFHPKHSENGKLYAYYTILSQGNAKVRLSEFTTFQDDINRVDKDSERVILEVDEPQDNHNGGQILFGVDGYLYAFLGDGGGGGDEHGEHGNGQNLTSLLGKVLRINVDLKDEGSQYGIPADNPFVKEDPTIKKHEIYAYGARNMWRCSVDRGDAVTGENRGRIFCGDVGQALYEEVDIIVNGGNYGWRGKEGYECYDVDLCYNLENEVLPIDVYDHSVGISITGGYVYRGSQSSKLQGKYIYGDWGNGAMFTLTEKRKEWIREDICFASDEVCTDGLVNTYPNYILAFGEDESGEVYVLSTDRSAAGHPGGKILRIVDPSFKPFSNGELSTTSDGSSDGTHAHFSSAWRGILWAALSIALIALAAIVLKKLSSRNEITTAVKKESDATESSPLLTKSSK